MRVSVPKAIRPPVMPAHLEPLVLTDLDQGAVVETARIDSCALAGAKAGSARFDGVHLSGGALTESKLTNLTWLDVLCERTDLSMIDWRGAKLTRVVVRGSRITGGKLVEGVFESVRFVDCQMDYASFTLTRFRNVLFESCRLHEADFHGADLTGTAFNECELLGSDFTGAKLDAVDVSSSKIGGIKVGPADVRGLVVDRAQASELAKLFGLVVRD